MTTDSSDGPGLAAVWSLGAMSGTSLDGVDAALIETDGKVPAAFGPSLYRPYSDAERAVLARALSPEAGDAAAVAAGAVVTEAHIDAFQSLLSDPDCPRPAVIGFHGQTIWHDPAAGVTRQVGDAAAIAAAIGVDVVHDFRSADMAAGGQGAPMAPFYHFALAKRADLAAPAAFLNLGGVGNVTWVDPWADGPEADGALLAFDTGPANALIDDWMAARTGAPFDKDGAAAEAGAINEAVLARMLDHPYFAAPAPKSLDRNAFQAALEAAAALSTEDGAATLTAFTATSVAAAAALLPSPPSRWLVCGGGRRNPALMRMLAERLSASVKPVEAIDVDGDMLEAQAFAHLAVRSLAGAPLSAPGATGVPAPCHGGRLAKAA